MMKKRILSILLALALVLSLMPSMTIVAADSAITVYVTASYEGEALTSASSGLKAEDGVAMICAAVELSSDGATVEDALTQLAKDYYNSDGSGFSGSSYGSYVGSYWGISTAGGLGSVILLNGTDTGYGLTSAAVSNGDCVTLSLFDYLSDYSGSISSSYIGFSDGTYMGAASVVTGNSLSFSAYSQAAPITYNCNVFLTGFDTVSYNYALTASSGVYSYTFDTPGTYLLIFRDTNHGNSGSAHGLSAAKITVADTITNSAPSLKSGGAAAATASTYVGKPYTLALSSIFKDANGDAMTYKVKVGDAEYVTASSNYSYTPTAAGTVTLVFKANDGKADSDDTFTVTLTVSSAPTLSAVLSEMSSYYSSALSFGSGSAFDWALADMVAYGADITDDMKQDYVDYVVNSASTSSTAAELARYIITLKALGYDATQIDTDGKGTYFDAVAAMLSKGETSIYTTPYILIALEQYGDDYTDEINSLITAILGGKLSGGGWNSYGSTIDADTTGPVLLALAPYYSDNSDVKSAVDAALSQLSGLQDSTGAIYSAYGYGACSTGVIIPALVALGKDPESFTDGLLLLYDADSRFQVYSGDSYSDEQGFRGLVAAGKYSSAGCSIYDFSPNASNPVVASAYYTNCLVEFSLIPTGAAVVVKDSAENALSALTGTSYDLAAGTYAYTVSASGYTAKSGTVTVSSAEAAHTKKAVSVSLSSAVSSSSSIAVTVYIKTHDATACSNSYTYKSNSSAYYNIVSQTVTLASGSTVFDALDAACTAAGISYVETSYGYIGTINGLSELDHGKSSGWLYKVGGTVPTIACRNYPLTSSCTVIWFYTDDYTQEYGSESWSGTSAASTAAAGSVTAVLDKATGIASLSGTALSEFISSISSSGDKAGSNAVITVTVPEGASSMSLIIPQAAIAALGGTSNTSLSVETGFGSLSFDPEAIDKISSSGKEVKLSVSKLDSSVLSADAKGLIGDRPVYNFSITAGDTKITDLGGGSASISLPYTLNTDEYPNAVVVYYIDDSGALNTVTGAYNEKTGTVDFVTTHFSVYAIGYNKVSFSDVAQTAWYSDAVSFCAARGIINGTGDNKFSPDDALTRGQFIVMLMRAYGIEPDESPSDNFSDAGDTYYTSYLSAAKRLGISTGVSNNSFAPDIEISRQDMLTMLYRALGDLGLLPAQASAAAVEYTDASDISVYAEDAIEAFTESGVISGSNGLLCPKSGTPRAQMAQVLYKLMKH